MQTRGNYLWNFFWWQLSKAFASANQMGHFFKRFACFECVESAFCQAFSVFLNAQNIMRKRPPPYFSSMVCKALIKSAFLSYLWSRMVSLLTFFLFLECFSVCHFFGNRNHSHVFIPSFISSAFLLWWGSASNKHMILIMADCWVGHNCQCRYGPVRLACIMVDGL